MVVNADCFCICCGCDYFRGDSFHVPRTVVFFQLKTRNTNFFVYCGVLVGLILLAIYSLAITVASISVLILGAIIWPIRFHTGVRVLAAACSISTIVIQALQQTGTNNLAIVHCAIVLHLSLTSYASVSLFSSLYYQKFSWLRIFDIISVVVNLLSAISAGRAREITYAGWDVGTEWGWFLTAASLVANWADVVWTMRLLGLMSKCRWCFRRIVYFVGAVGRAQTAIRSRSPMTTLRNSMAPREWRQAADNWWGRPTGTEHKTPEQMVWLAECYGLAVGG
jgi:hypothetical protein